MQNRSDEQLIADYLCGDKESLEVLFKQYLKPIYSFVYRYLGNEQDAEDAAQEVFVKVWRHLKKFDQSKSFKTWIFSIAKNTAIDSLKKKKATPFSEFSARGGSAFGGEYDEGENKFLETLADPAPLPQELLDGASISRLLASAIEKISQKYRTVLSLRHNDGLTFREIAEYLGEPLHTVKSRYRRALILLKAILQ